MQSKGLPRVFPSTTVQKHQFFGAQLSRIHTCLVETQTCSPLRPWPPLVLLLLLGCSLVDCSLFCDPVDCSPPCSSVHEDAVRNGGLLLSH